MRAGKIPLLAASKSATVRCKAEYIATTINKTDAPTQTVVEQLSPRPYTDRIRSRLLCTPRRRRFELRVQHSAGTSPGRRQTQKKRQHAQVSRSCASSRLNIIFFPRLLPCACLRQYECLNVSRLGEFSVWSDIPCRSPSGIACPCAKRKYIKA